MNRSFQAIVLSLVASPLAAQSPCFDWASNLGSQGIDNPQPFFSAIYGFKVWNDGSPAGQRLYAGGHFSSIGGVAANNVAVWNGVTWQPLGSGVSGFPGYLPFMGGVPDQVESFCIHDDGTGAQLYVGGAYTDAGGHAATGIARWDGASWTAIGGVEAEAAAMASWDDGVTGPSLYVGGYLYLVSDGSDNSCLVWRGGAWHKITSGPGTPLDFCTFDDGSGLKLYAAGGVAGSPDISRLNGTVWEGVGGGFGSTVFALCVHDDGSGSKLYAAGVFTTAGGAPASRIARWDGSRWSAVGSGIGNGSVYELVSYPDGFGGAKLVAIGDFTMAGGSPANGCAMWNGSSWSALGSGLTGAGEGWALGVYDDGQGSGRDLYAGGKFTSAGGHPVSCFAKWEGCGGTGTPFCPGDGTLGTACPCGNFGSTGHGCASSTVNAGGLLAASGHPTPDTIVLSASDLKVNASSIFLQGNAMIASGVVFGDGVRCAGGSLLRLALKSATGGNATYPESGDLSISARAAALGQPIAPSSSRIYQVYYRDSDLAFCPNPPGNTWNITNAMRIVW